MKRWYDKLALGSPNTAEFAIGRPAYSASRTRSALPGLPHFGRRRRKALEDLIQDHVTRREKQKNSPAYIAGMMKGQITARYNEVELKQRVKVRNADSTLPGSEERVPRPFVGRWSDKGSLWTRSSHQISIQGYRQC